MARQKTDLRISLKGVSGETVRLNLSLDVFGERWHVYRDGALSMSVPHGSSTTVAQHIQRWLIGQAGSVRSRRNCSVPVERQPPTRRGVLK